MFVSGLCSSDTSNLTSELGKPESKDFTVASEALVANAQRESANANGVYLLR